MNISCLFLFCLCGIQGSISFLKAMVAGFWKTYCEFNAMGQKWKIIINFCSICSSSILFPTFCSPILSVCDESESQSTWVPHAALWHFLSQEVDVEGFKGGRKSLLSEAKKANFKLPLTHVFLLERSSEGWCPQEVAASPPKLTSSVVEQLWQRLLV